MFLDDPIVAIATPPGLGGLAVVRVSGRGALAVADAVFRPGRRDGLMPSAAASHTVHHGHVVAGGREVDEVLLTVLRGPRTYTREDTVEVGCHGGSHVARMVLEAFLAAGARAAGPGEFTRRAFLNGRLDLAQAEAVADLIHARSSRAVHAANAQLSGALSRRIEALRESLMHVLAHVEAHVDFPDEDIAPETGAALARRVEAALGEAQRLVDSARQGRLLREGARVAIVGAPNAGKSSLLNALLGVDRAIVSDVPGTTRDTVEDMATVAGFPVVLVDTAGLRESEDAIEKEGMRRSREAARGADLVLQVVDVTLPPPEDVQLEAGAGVPWLRVANKCDLAEHPGFASDAAWLRVSCRTGAGLDALRDAMAARLVGPGAGVGLGAGDEVAVSARHHDALRRAMESMSQVLESMRQGQALDLVAADLRVAVQAVGEVVGKTSTEDLLDRIFSSFCIGK
ncbi:MAG: tRNA uridine-5-carboxymethylaminomethyl(34) synthesis GTPase MnmE [Verrucomicrobiota bacterium]|jgi:tRNA modification GTPase